MFLREKNEQNSVGGQLTKREIVRVPDEVKSTPQFISEHIEVMRW